MSYSLPTPQRGEERERGRRKGEKEGRERGTERWTDRHKERKRCSVVCAYKAVLPAFLVQLVCCRPIRDLTSNRRLEELRNNLILSLALHM